MASPLPNTEELSRFRDEVITVAKRRDLATATEYGARLNRLIAPYIRQADSLSPSQRALIEIAQNHVRAMTDCPRRMRLDNSWQDDFVVEATKAVDALISLAAMSN